MRSRAFTPEEFRDTLGHYPTGVTVVTALDNDGEPIGMVVGSFTSVSLDPPLVAYLPMKSSGTFAKLRQARTFCVNVLAADQLDLSRRFSSRRDDKFDGVEWCPAQNGAPILDGAVSWIECSVDSISEAGDHYIVLGRVLDLEVSRPTLPLLFFQGGYGRFALPSLVAPAEPELIEAIRASERARDHVEEFAMRNEVDCSILARVGNELVFVLTANHAADSIPVPAGSRVPMVPPLGTAFLTDADASEVEAWLAPLPPDDHELRDRCASLVETVKARGFTLSLVPDAPADRVSLMSEYSSSTRLPAHERSIRQMITSTVDLYEPHLRADETYSLHSIGMPVQGVDGPRLVVRIAGLRPDVDVTTIEQWTAELRALTATVAKASARA